MHLVDIGLLLNVNDDLCRPIPCVFAGSESEVSDDDMSDEDSDVMPTGEGVSAEFMDMAAKVAAHVRFHFQTSVLFSGCLLFSSCWEVHVASL